MGIHFKNSTMHINKHCLNFYKALDSLFQVPTPEELHQLYINYISDINTETIICKLNKKIKNVLYVLIHDECDSPIFALALLTTENRKLIYENYDSFEQCDQIDAVKKIEAFVESSVILAKKDYDVQIAYVIYKWRLPLMYKGITSFNKQESFNYYKIPCFLTIFHVLEKCGRNDQYFKEISLLKKVILSSENVNLSFVTDRLFTLINRFSLSIKEYSMKELRYLADFMRPPSLVAYYLNHIYKGKNFGDKSIYLKQFTDFIKEVFPGNNDILKTLHFYEMESNYFLKYFQEKLKYSSKDFWNENARHSSVFSKFALEMIELPAVTPNIDISKIIDNAHKREMNVIDAIKFGLTLEA